jgi:hypothetical protein
MSDLIEEPVGSSADICRRNGWKAGTRLSGDEGYGPTVIEITAIGEEYVLAKSVSHNGQATDYPDESLWELCYRDWVEVPA